MEMMAFGFALMLAAPFSGPAIGIIIALFLHRRSKRR
jgi:hypothetical protein